MVLVDVQGRNPLEELVIKAMGQVLETFPLTWICPRFPYRSKLHNHIGGGEDKLGQCNESLEQGSGFGLWTWCHARNGAFSQEGSHGKGVYAKPEHPGLGAVVIG